MPSPFSQAVAGQWIWPHRVLTCEQFLQDPTSAANSVNSGANVTNHCKQPWSVTIIHPNSESIYVKSIFQFLLGVQSEIRWQNLIHKGVVRTSVQTEIKIMLFVVSILPTLSSLCSKWG